MQIKQFDAMNHVVEKRPVSVTVIGWLVVASGIWMLLGGLGSAMQSLVWSTPFDPLPRKMLERFPVYAFIFRHYFAITILQCLISILEIISGIYFLRLRPWARNLIEWICWVMIVGVLLIGIQFVLPPLDYFSVVGLMCTTAFIVPFAILVYFLRTPEVRKTCQATLA